MTPFASQFLSSWQLLRAGMGVGDRKSDSCGPAHTYTLAHGLLMIGSELGQGYLVL